MACASFARPGTRLPLAASCAAALLVPALARTQCLAERPDQPGAVFSWGTAPTAVTPGPAGRALVHRALEGPHAPAVLDPEAHALLVAQVTERALEAFGNWGYRVPFVDDDNAPCTSNGGGPEVDVYLFAFGSADGHQATERCTETAQGSRRCSGFLLVENDFVGSSYRSLSEALSVVVPHEVFHLVQAAYVEVLDPWWAEATAQWAADRATPGLGDLERFLPAFFARPERTLHGPAGGVAAAYLYGTAVVPLTLEALHGPDAVRDVFEELALGAPGTPVALDAALARHRSSLADFFVVFATWNAATGPRHAGQGHPRGASFPPVALAEALAPEAEVQGRLGGLSARYHPIEGTERRRLEVVVDPSLAVVVVPLESGRAALSSALAPPAEVEQALVVVVNPTTSLADARYTLRLTALGDGGLDVSDAGGTEGGDGVPAVHSDAGPTDGGTPASTRESDGCSLGRPFRGAPGFALLLSLLLLVASHIRRSVCRRLTFPSRPPRATRQAPTTLHDDTRS